MNHESKRGARKTTSSFNPVQQGQPFAEIGKDDMNQIFGEAIENSVRGKIRTQLGNNFRYSMSHSSGDVE